MPITKEDLYQKLIEKKCFQKGSENVGSERELARRLGLNKETIFRFFRGETDGMLFGNVLFICAYLGISCSDLPIEGEGG